MRYIRSENLKYKRSFSRKLIFVVPIITAFVAVIFGGIRNFQAQTIYWWYTFLLPGTVAIYCSLSEKKEKSVRYHTFYTLSIDLENDLIYGSIGEVVCLLDKEYKISHLKKMHWYKKLKEEGYNLKIGTGYAEIRSISYTSGIMSNLVAPKKGGIIPEYSILYCTNYQEFLREDVVVRKRKKQQKATK